MPLPLLPPLDTDDTLTTIVGGVEVGITIHSINPHPYVGNHLVGVRVRGPMGWFEAEQLTTMPMRVVVGVRINGLWKNAIPPVYVPPPPPWPVPPPGPGLTPPGGPSAFVAGVSGYQTDLQFSRAINEPGSGTVTTHGAGGFHGGDLYFFVGGAVKHGGFVTKTTDVVIDPAEEAGVVTSTTAEGFLAEWRYMKVLPDLGAEDPERLGAPAARDRVFNFASSNMNTDQWSGAVATAPNYGGNPNDKVKSKRPVFTQPESWPWMQAQWIWATKTDNGAPPGDVYFRKTFGPAPGYYALHVACDDEYEIWLDGVKLGSRSGFYAGQKETYDVVLGNHFHLMAARCTNRGGSAGLKLALMPYEETSTPAKAKLQSDGGWKCLKSQRPPGMTVGQILRILLQEAQDRGVMDGWGLAFSDDTDSNGRAWPVLTDYSLPIGMDGLAVLNQMGQEFFDFWCSPGSRSLVATQSGTGGSSGTESPLRKLSYSTDSSGSYNSVLVGYDGPDGYAYVGSGGREGFLRLDGVQTKEQAMAAGAAWLGVYSKTRVQQALEGLPKGEGGPDDTYWYDIGGTLSGSRVAGISVSMGPDNLVTVIPELTDSLELEEQKLQRQLASYASGAIGQAGGPSVGTAFLDNPRAANLAQLPPFGIHGLLADIEDPMPAYIPSQPMLITRVFCTLRTPGTSQTSLILKVNGTAIILINIAPKQASHSVVMPANKLVLATDQLTWEVAIAGLGAAGLTIQTTVAVA